MCLRDRNEYIVFEDCVADRTINIPSEESNKCISRDTCTKLTQGVLLKTQPFNPLKRRLQRQ